MRTNPENQKIVDFFEFNLESHELDLEGWGRVDFYAYHNDILVLIEVEKGQKHPNTNVLKLWPYIEENPDQKMFLIHVIRNENKAPKNRLALCDFTGKKLENIFPTQFSYMLIRGNPWDYPNTNEEIKKRLVSLL
tara:strand:+ start:164 stop:568 length:405 start_codon:yes stop_codon:yes gene_type:complete